VLVKVVVSSKHSQWCLLGREGGKERED
jgi:hypothetical protein